MSQQAPGSTIVFDYCWQEFVDGDLDDLRGARPLRERTAAQGEPIRSGIPRGGTRAYVESHGLELIDDFDADDGVERYLTRSDGTVVGWMWEFGGMAHARVPGRS
jgi:hypothetical protein